MRRRTGYVTNHHFRHRDVLTHFLGPNEQTTGDWCLRSYARADSFRRHIFDAEGNRKRSCVPVPTRMPTSEYKELCRLNGVDPKIK